MIITPDHRQRVTEILHEKPYLQGLLQETAKILIQVFGCVEMDLRPNRDIEKKDLLLTISSPYSVDETIERLELFDDWWLTEHPCNEDLLITTEYI